MKYTAQHNYEIALMSYQHSSESTILVLDGTAHGMWQRRNTLTGNDQSWEGIKHAEDKQQTRPGRKGWKIMLMWQSMQ